MTALPLVGARRALIAILIIDGLHYFQFTAAKFNHDVIQLPLWALAGYALHAGLRQGTLGHWVLLGLAVGLALWAKYFIAMLALRFPLFMLLDPEPRKALARPRPGIEAPDSQFAHARLMRIVAVWGVVLGLFALAFVADYLVLPGIDHRARAVLFPGDRLAAALTERFHAATGRPLAYVIGSMWDGGNVAHYSTER